MLHVNTVGKTIEKIEPKLDSYGFYTVLLILLLIGITQITEPIHKEIISTIIFIGWTTPYALRFILERVLPLYKKAGKEEILNSWKSYTVFAIILTILVLSTYSILYIPNSTLSTLGHNQYDWDYVQILFSLYLITYILVMSKYDNMFNIDPPEEYRVSTNN